MLHEIRQPVSSHRLASNGGEGDWEVRDAKGRARPLGSLGALGPRATPRGINVPSPEEDDDLSEEVSRDHAQKLWACDQLPDDQVAHVRAQLARVPWLGKPWRARRGPKSPRNGHVSDGSVGVAGALNFFGGPPVKV